MQDDTGWPHSTSEEIPLCFPCIYIFPYVFFNFNTQKLTYFVNGLHHLLNHNLNLKIIHFLCLVQIPCFLLNSLNSQILSFPCALAILW